MFLTIHIILLLFAFGSSKHTLSRIQITNGSEIYQIREKPNNIIEIIAPKSKIPTLREIIYFRIKETPYISHPQEEEPPQEEGPDFDESKRPFTNGPGFQFIDYGPIDNASSDSDSGSSGSDSESSKSNPDSNDSTYSDRDRHENNNNSKEIKNDSKESNNDNYEDKIDVYKTKIDNNIEIKANNDKLISGSLDADKNYLDKDKDNEENDNKDLNKRLDGGKSKNINENNQSTKPAAVNKTKAVTLEQNEQFDEAKEKYHENNKKSDNSTKLLRRKREISYNIPPPPSLPPLNLKMLPGFIQRMISNVPTLKNMLSPDKGESNYQGENRPGTYGIHLNKDKGFMWNNLPFINQGNYVNVPSNMINKKKKEEYPTDRSLESDDSNSGSDDDSLYSDNDSGYNAEPEEEEDQSIEDNSITPPIWPVIASPSIGFNKFKPHQSITKEKELDNSVSKVCKTCNEPHKPTIQGPKDKNIKCRQLENRETEPKEASLCAQNNLKKKVEKSFDNAGKKIPPPLSQMKQNIVETPIKNGECVKAYACSERKKPSSPPTNNFNQCETEPTNADKCETKANGSTNSPPHEDKGTTQVVPESSTKNQTQETPTKSNNSNEPKKENLSKNKDNSDDKKDNKDVETQLDNLLKKDEFWKWITNWTAGYIAGLNERLEPFVKKQIAKQVNETENQQNKKEKDKIDTNKNDLIKQNETIANATTNEPANKTNENNDNRHTTEKSIPGTKNTDNNITPKKEPSKVRNETVSNGSKSNKTTPANPETISNTTNANEKKANVTTENNTPKTNNTVKNIAPKKEKSKIVPNRHRSNKTTPAIPNTIYGNAMDSDHVTNIFIFYPNAANNETAKDIEAFLGNQNNNVVVAGTPQNDNKAPDSGPALANKTSTPSDPALAKKTAPPADPALANKTAAPADPALAKKTTPPADSALANKTAAPADPALANKTAAPADPAASANPATVNKTAAPADTVPATDTAAKTT